jgi:hypothetical protein
MVLQCRVLNRFFQTIKINLDVIVREPKKIMGTSLGLVKKENSLFKQMDERKLGSVFAKP